MILILKALWSIKKIMGYAISNCYVIKKQYFEGTITTGELNQPFQTFLFWQLLN